MPAFGPATKREPDNGRQAAGHEGEHLMGSPTERAQVDPEPLKPSSKDYGHRRCPAGRQDDEAAGNPWRIRTPWRRHLGACAGSHGRGMTSVKAKAELRWCGIARMTVSP
jgi:hypothetical protein